MLDKPLHQVVGADVQALIDAGVAESRRLEFKEQLPAGNDKGLVEFCKDVTAMANAQGGDIIFGVREERDDANKPTGKPAAIVGTGDANLDAEQLRLTNLLRDGVEPFLFGVEVQVVSHEAGPLLIIRVPRSLSAPHMVTTKDHRRFYVRTANGTAPMDVDELRASFLGGQAFEQRVEAFRRQRLMKLLAGEGPIPEIGGRLLVLHFIPLSPSAQVDVTGRDLARRLQPLDSGKGWDGRHNLDGYVAHPRGRYAYTQLFRNGAMESATTVAFGDDRPNHQQLVLGPEVAKELLRTFSNHLDPRRELGVRPPYALAASLIGTKGRHLYLGEHWHDFDEPAVATEDVMTIPEIVVHDRPAPDDVQAVLRPLLDLIWQAFGHSRCGYYGDDGKLNMRHLR